MRNAIERSRLGQIEWLARSSISRGGAVPPLPPGFEFVDFAPFTFASGTMLLLGLVTGAVIDRLVIAVTEPFDVPATLALGTTAEPGMLVASGDMTGTFDAPELAAIPAPDLLRLVVAAPGATRGAGIVLYKVIP